jgi:hypothetical protein
MRCNDNTAMQETFLSVCFISQASGAESAPESLLAQAAMGQQARATK